MDYFRFEEYLNKGILALDDEFEKVYARRHKWEMFLPENYEKIRANMDKQGIKPDVVDIGCGAGFGSEYFSDGSYIGVDKRHPHIGFGGSAAKLGDKFFNEGKKNVSYIIDGFPSETVGKILKKRTLISSMSLSAYGESNKTYESYCNCMANADNLYVCGAPRFSKFVNDFFGGSEQIGEHIEGDIESAVACPIIYVKV